MTDEKPFHVRVAEALGCKLVKQASALAVFKPGDFYWACGCVEDGKRAGPHGSRLFGVRLYDTDWAATGPLVERYRINLNYDPEWQEDPQVLAPWVADSEGFDELGFGHEPLQAICNLILVLHAAGKLKEAA